MLTGRQRCALLLAASRSDYTHNHNIGVMLGLYWGYVGVILGIMENKMETTIFSERFAANLVLEASRKLWTVQPSEARSRSPLP